MHIFKSIIGAALLLVVILIIGCGRPSGSPEITLENAEFTPSTIIIGSVSAFLAIKNSGDSDDSLVGCSIKEFPAAIGKIHDMVDQRMKEMKEVNIPSGKTLHLKSGALHLMFFKIPEEPLKDVKELTLVLKFKKSGKKEVVSKYAKLEKMKMKM